MPDPIPTPPSPTPVPDPTPVPVPAPVPVQPVTLSQIVVILRGLGTKVGMLFAWVKEMESDPSVITLIHDLVPELQANAGLMAKLQEVISFLQLFNTSVATAHPRKS